jgi:hypothetical protein
VRLTRDRVVEKLIARRFASLLRRIPLPSDSIVGFHESVVEVASDLFDY